MTPESIGEVVDGISHLSKAEVQQVARNFEIRRNLPSKKAYLEAIYAKIFGRLGSHLRAQQ